MVVTATTIAVVGAGLAVGGTAYNVMQQKKAAKAQKRAAQLSRQRQQLQDALSRREAIREARIARARSVNAAANQGVSDSSAAQGGAGSIVTQGNVNISFLDQNVLARDQAGEYLGRAQRYTQRASTGAAIAGFGASMFSNADVLSNRINSIFGSNANADG